MNKSEVRQIIKRKKSELSKYVIVQASRKITDVLYKSDIYQDNANVFVYVSYNQEVDTHELIQRCLKDGKHVYVPRVTSSDSMEFYEIRDMNELVDGYKGIPEPDVSCPVSHETSGLFIMPGLAFDYDFNRIGYGGGFYDRYLERNNTYIKTALCFDFQLMEHIPHEEHDLKPDIIITEKTVIRREK